MNPGLASRSPGCWVCRKVSAVEDVTVRLLDEDLNDLPPKDAITYLKSLGHAASPASWSKRIIDHRKHVRRSIESPPAVYTPLRGEATAPLAPSGGPPAWVRGPDRAIEVGMTALERIARRLEDGDMADSDTISAARLGLTAASTVGNWFAKGRQMQQVDRILDFVADTGMDDDD